MKKICFITTGNIESIATMKRAFGMANPLTAIGFDVHIVMLNCKENIERAALECNELVNIHCFEASSAIKEITQKTRIVKQVEPDYIFFCAFVARNYILRFKLSKIPLLLIEHSELLSSIKSYGIIRRIKEFFFERYSIFYADGLVCASKYLLNFYEKLNNFAYNSKLKFLYSPYAFNSDILKPAMPSDELLKKYKDKFVLVFMGSLNRDYGLFAMLNAMKDVSSINNNIILLFIGGGEDKQAAIDFVNSNNLTSTVHFAGYVAEEELSSYLSVANAFIAPLNNTVQDWARCPSKIYMYLPFGKPILTCKIGEPAEIFQDNGLYFNTEDYSTLSNLILKVYSSNYTYSFGEIEKHTWKYRVEVFNSWIEGFDVKK
ncbi:MAG: glycosyltransferase [Flavobacterium sp.]|nr:glycosyltransferase [Flavobacterium sp.]